MLPSECGSAAGGDVIEDRAESELLAAALRTSEERYRRLMEALPDGLTLMGLDGSVKWTSARTYEQFRSTPDVVIGRSVMTWIAPEDQDRAATVIAGLVAGVVDSADALDYRMLRADGTRFHATIHAAVLVDAAGEPEDVLVVVRDAEADYRARLEHETLAATWRLFLESKTVDEVYARMPDLLAGVLGIGRVTLAVLDPSSGELFLVGQSGEWTGPPAPARLPMVGTVNGLVATSGATVVEVDVDSRPESRFDILKSLGVASVLGVPIRGRQGVLGVVGLETSVRRPDLGEAADLLQVAGDYLGLEIERKRSARALTSSEDRYRNFVERFDGIAYTWRPQAPDPVRMDGAVEEISGYAAADFESGRLRWFDIVHPDDLPALQQAEELLLALPDYRLDDEYRILCRDGTLRWVRDVSRRVEAADAAEDELVVLGVVYDVTERRESEARVADSEGRLPHHLQQHQRRDDRPRRGRARARGRRPCCACTASARGQRSSDSTDHPLYDPRGKSNPTTCGHVEDILGRDAAPLRGRRAAASRRHDLVVEVYLPDQDRRMNMFVLWSSRDISERKAAEEALRNKNGSVGAGAASRRQLEEYDVGLGVLWASGKTLSASTASSTPDRRCRSRRCRRRRCRGLARLWTTRSGDSSPEDDYDEEFEVGRGTGRGDGGRWSTAWPGARRRTGARTSTSA